MPGDYRILTKKLGLNSKSYLKFWIAARRCEGHGGDSHREQGRDVEECTTEVDQEVDLDGEERQQGHVDVGGLVRNLGTTDCGQTFDQKASSKVL